jgi:hypothetical protein
MKLIENLKKIIHSRKTHLVLMLLSFIITVYLLLFYLNDVSQVNREYFQNQNSKGSLNCYFFYTYNCPHSQKLLRTHWKTLNEKYSNKILFNKIDCLHPNTKEISNKFNVKEVPSIVVFKDSTNNNITSNLVEFKGERTLSNLENFLIKQINLNSNSSSSSNENFVNNTTSLSQLNTIKGDVINDVEFYHNEDLVNEEYQYSIKYKDPKKSQYNLSQTINEKKSQLKSWQGSYTVISEYIRNNAETLNDKKDLAYSIKNKITEWHLCDIDILNRIKNNISSIENNQIDLDINQAIQYACGFTG